MSLVNQSHRVFSLTKVSKIRNSSRHLLHKIRCCCNCSSLVWSHNALSNIFIKNFICDVLCGLAAQYQKAHRWTWLSLKSTQCKPAKPKGRKSLRLNPWAARRWHDQALRSTPPCPASRPSRAIRSASLAPLPRPSVLPCLGCASLHG